MKFCITPERSGRQAPVWLIFPLIAFSPSTGPLRPLNWRVQAHTLHVLTEVFVNKFLFPLAGVWSAILSYSTRISIRWMVCFCISIHAKLKWVKKIQSREGGFFTRSSVQVLVHWIKTPLSISWIQNHFEYFKVLDQFPSRILLVDYDLWETFILSTSPLVYWCECHSCQLKFHPCFKNEV